MPIPSWKQRQQQQSRYQASLLHGEQLLEEGNPENALKVFLAASELAPPGDNRPFANVCRCYRRLAKQALQADHLPEVIRCLEAMLAFNGSLLNLKAMDFKVLGEAYFEQGQLEQAKQAFFRAQEIDPAIKGIQTKLNAIKADEIDRQWRELR